MWDSLESVWKAADADPECEAYVIPIPYYDKNPDGTFRDFHYEGDLYPDYVPVTDYKNYDFESHRPDAIFIHNPYDEANASANFSFSYPVGLSMASIIFNTALKGIDAYDGNSNIPSKSLITDLAV